MSEKTNATEQPVESAADSGDIMQHIQDMIGDLLKNAVDKMQKTETSEQLGGAPEEASSSELPAQMGITEIKGFVGVMQKFIDNVNVMIAQLETGSSEYDTDDQFLEGYLATADNVLEIAAFSMKDPLTGLSNRYGFDNRLILEWNRATRDKSDLSLIIFKVDDFEECDNLIKAVSETLNSSIKRTTDFIARWSDDEFAVLLPITYKGGATIVTERICKEVGDMTYTDIAGNEHKASISIGVGVHTPGPDDKPVDFINRTYNAFLKAAETEGNSVIFA